jgi:carbon monoxide dehydrogenase subunit G
MGEARAEATIEAPADDIWKRVSDFGDLSWMGGVDSCTLDGDDRTIKMSGMEIVERRLRVDEANRSLTYGIVGGVPVGHHQATITVTPKGDTSSHVTYDVDTDDAMVEMMKGVYQGALDNLKSQLEG